MSEKALVIPSSGNVFADLGFEDPEEQLVQAELILRIRQIIQRRRLSEPRAAEVLGIAEPDVARLVRGDLGEFSTDRLLRCLTALDLDVDIVIRRKPRSRRRGRIAVVAA